jgi:integrase
MPIDRKGKLWRARATIPGTGGKMRILGTFKTKTEAQAAVDRAKVDLQRGAWVDPKQGRRTLGQFWEQYRETSAWRDLRPSTKNVYEQSWRAHIAPHFEHRPLGAIRRSEVQTWIDTLKHASKPNVVNRAHRVLRMLLNIAVADDFIARNPALHVKVPSVPRKEQEIVWSPEELRRIADAIPDHYRDLVQLLGFCGLRIGEAAGLRWEHIDLETGELHIREAVVVVKGRLVRGEPKTGNSRRTIVLPGVLWASLNARHDRERADPADAVFTRPDGRLLNRYYFLNNVWYPALKRAGVKRGTVHDLRHTAASLAIMAGASAVDVRDFLGHCSVAVTDRYAHMFEAKRRALADAMDGYMISTSDFAPDLPLNGARRQVTP